jgi:hypothetical protein
LIYPALLEDLPWLFPKLLELSPEKANFICTTVLNPLPVDNQCAPLILKFLLLIPNKLLAEWPAVFTPKAIIERYIGLQKPALTSLLRELMAKVGCVIDCFTVDWDGPSFPLSLELCENPPGFLVREAAQFVHLPLSWLGSVLLKLRKIRDKDLAEIAWNTLLQGLLFFGASATLVSPDGSALPEPKCCWREREFQQLFEATVAPIERAPLFKLLSSCIEYLD